MSGDRSDPRSDGPPEIIADIERLIADASPAPAETRPVDIDPVSRAHLDDVRRGTAGTEDE